MQKLTLTHGTKETQANIGIDLDFEMLLLRENKVHITSIRKKKTHNSHISKIIMGKFKMWMVISFVRV